MTAVKEKDFFTHNDDLRFADLVSVDTSLKGTTILSYRELVEKFGEPIIRCDDKTIFEWVVVLKRKDLIDIIITIYDWKENRSPQLIRELEEMEWNVGGHTLREVRLACEALGI